MKTQELSALPASLSAPDFKTIEPHLTALDKHLTLRSYIEGYSIGELDTKIWITIRTNKVAYAFIKKGACVNLCRWFSYIDQTHPEIQEEIKAKDEAEKAKKAALSKAGGSYAMALQDVEKGVVTRFPPEPSYEDPSLVADSILTVRQRIPAHWTHQSRATERLLRTRALQGHFTFAIRRYQSFEGEAGVSGFNH